MKILFLTGNESNHNYFIDQVTSQLGAKKSVILKNYSGLSNIDFYTNVYKKDKMSPFEKAYLGNFIRQRNYGFKEYQSRSFANEFIFNNAKDFNKKLESLLEKEGFDYILSYGAPLIKYASVFNSVAKTVNFHFGLSRFYRGGDTNAYALSRGEFHKVGLTAHKLEKKVDSGKILFEIGLDNSAFSQVNTINELKDFLLRKATEELIRLIRGGIFNYTNAEYSDSELVLNTNINIGTIIEAEKNLQQIKRGDKNGH